MTDVIADLFTRIRNSLRENHDYCLVPHSNLKFRIVEILHSYGFINRYEIISEKLTYKSIKIVLKYSKNGDSVISSLIRVSKQSKRIYVKKKNVPKPKRGFGLSIISTSKGVVCGKEARLKNVGGELLGIVW